MHVCVCRQSQTQTVPEIWADGNGVGDVRQRSESANCQRLITHWHTGARNQANTRERGGRDTHTQRGLYKVMPGVKGI